MFAGYLYTAPNAPEPSTWDLTQTWSLLNGVLDSRLTAGFSCRFAEPSDFLISGRSLKHVEEVLPRCEHLESLHSSEQEPFASTRGCGVAASATDIMRGIRTAAER